MSHPDTSLPAGFSIVHGGQMQRVQVVEHFRTSGWVVDAHEVQNIHPDTDGGGHNLSIGILDTSKLLIAYGGLIKRDCEWAEMGDLIVNPDYRHRGLAKYLIAKRVQSADELRVEQLTIEDLEPANPLLTFYQELGFTYDTDQEVFIRQRMKLM